MTPSKQNQLQPFFKVHLPHRVVMAVLGMVIMTLQASAAPTAQMAAETQNPLLAAPAQNYPFQDGYPIAQNKFERFQAHAVLTVPKPLIRQGNGYPVFDVDIRLYNTQGWSHFYNVYWDRSIPLPGRLALYDADKHYLCDLLQGDGGSVRLYDVQDWTPIRESGYAGAALSVFLPYPSSRLLHPGTYYLQVIYLQNAITPPSETDKISYPTNASIESFRSNAVKITVTD